MVVAYIMTITDFGWEDALSAVRAARSCANPNMGFQRQLQEFERHDVDHVCDAYIFVFNEPPHNYTWVT